MKIKAKLTGSLGKYPTRHLSEDVFELEMESGALVKDVIRALGIPPSEALFVTREDQILSQYDSLLENDALVVVQAFEGG